MKLLRNQMISETKYCDVLFIYLSVYIIYIHDQNIISNLLMSIFCFSFLILVTVLLDSWFVSWLDLTFKQSLLIFWLLETELQISAKSLSDILKLAKFKCSLLSYIFKHILLTSLFIESNLMLWLFASYSLSAFNSFYLIINFLKTLTPFLDKLKLFKLSDSFYS